MTSVDKASLVFEKVVKFGLIASLFSSLLISTTTLFPFFVGKVTFLHTIITITLVAYLVLLLINPSRIKFRFSLISLSVLAYLAIYALSSFFSIDQYQSFWSTIERMEGLFHMLYYLLFYIMLSSFFRTKNEWLQFWRGAFVMGWLVGLYGVGQLWGVSGVLLASQDRIAATLGNATYVGTMFILLSYMSAILYFGMTRKTGNNFMEQV